jgi:hypothetical protein
MSAVGQPRESFDWAGVVDYAYAARYPQYELPGVTEDIHQAPRPAVGDHEGVPVAAA